VLKWKIWWTRIGCPFDTIGLIASTASAADVEGFTARQIQLWFVPVRPNGTKTGWHHPPLGFGTISGRRNVLGCAPA
jgi:hypothetical protein